MQECPECGTRYLTDDVAEKLMTIMNDLLQQPDELSSIRWDDAFTAA
jgi:hypothetical protein